MHGLRVAIAAALWFFVAGCSSSPQKLADEARQTAGSWAASVSLAAERWNGGAIPKPYFESLVTQARGALERESRRVRKGAGDAAAAPLDTVASDVIAIDDALELGDRELIAAYARRAAAAAPPRPVPPVTRPRPQ